MEFDSGIMQFIKLLVIVGLISMFYMIVMQKIKEQNHKITSLLSLVTTMATEITNLKQKPQEFEEFEETEETEELCELKGLGGLEGLEHFDTKESRKLELCSISDSDSDSDSDSESVLDIDFVKNEIIDEPEPEKIREEKIEFFETFEEKSTVLEPIESIDFNIENPNKPESVPSPKQDYSKLSVSELVDIVVNKNIITKEKAKKLKKKGLIELL